MPRFPASYQAIKRGNSSAPHGLQPPPAGDPRVLVSVPEQARASASTCDGHEPDLHRHRSATARHRARGLRLRALRDEGWHPAEPVRARDAAPVGRQQSRVRRPSFGSPDRIAGDRQGTGQRAGRARTPGIPRPLAGQRRCPWCGSRSASTTPTGSPKRASPSANSTPRLGRRRSSEEVPRTSNGTICATPLHPGTAGLAPRRTNCNGWAAGKPGRWSNDMPTSRPKRCKVRPVGSMPSAGTPKQKGPSAFALSP